MQPITTKVPNQGSVTIGSSTTAFLAGNPGRQVLWISNGSDEVIWLGIGQDAVLNQGIAVWPSSTLVWDVNLNAQAINAICASGSKVLSYCEVTN